MCHRGPKQPILHPIRRLPLLSQSFSLPHLCRELPLFHPPLALWRKNVSLYHHHEEEARTMSLDSLRRDSEGDLV